jgi:hypothetical protein
MQCYDALAMSTCDNNNNNDDDGFHIGFVVFLTVMIGLIGMALGAIFMYYAALSGVLGIQVKKQLTQPLVDYAQVKSMAEADEDTIPANEVNNPMGNI